LLEVLYVPRRMQFNVLRYGEVFYIGVRSIPEPDLRLETPLISPRENDCLTYITIENGP
jgi:hypothetical protein